ncbi:hypothetical protein K5I29_08130 [Flavobacterium agricola]|uniref:Uncharacterized protein n=1 Tax=Flavobacterium agricola TaxID=2870839 RepID=A0ABY6M068_9FLAO|nr:hypothetical protein [Flavobacterium agricola]UYW00516.1 hypothetical protein K5I29_08130 [Flavobacterium agricola]
MFKILHIHTDPKFFFDTLSYVDDRVDNSIIYVGTENYLIKNKLDKLNINYLIYSPEVAVNSILKDITDFDAVVLNEFCKIKTQIVSMASPENKFYLRLFGYELYQRNLHRYLHSKSIKYRFPIFVKDNDVKKYLKSKLKRVLKLDFRYNEQEQVDLYKKLNSVFLFSEEEYNELNTFFYLPKYIQLPLYPFPVNIKSKKGTIIVGNSKHLWNNHLEIFDIIKGTNPEIFLFYNYGPENGYTKQVEKEGGKIKNLIWQKDFLELDEFNMIYSTASALVINSYRQHALGNIFTAIMSGCKIYLNPKSPTFKWLINEGAIISSVYILKTDILKNNIGLTDIEMQHNINIYNKMRINYNSSNFITNIMSCNS